MASLDEIRRALAAHEPRTVSAAEKQQAAVAIVLCRRSGEPERHVVWGLTYRFLEFFFEVMGRPLQAVRNAS